MTERRSCALVTTDMLTTTCNLFNGTRDTDEKRTGVSDHLAFCRTRGNYEYRLAKATTRRALSTTQEAKLHSTVLNAASHWAFQPEMCLCMWELNSSSTNNCTSWICKIIISVREFSRVLQVREDDPAQTMSLNHLTQSNLNAATLLCHSCHRILCWIAKQVSTAQVCGAATKGASIPRRCHPWCQISQKIPFEVEMSTFEYIGGLA
jgi:hypothetical protein